MLEQEQKEVWREFGNLWLRSAEAEKVKINVASLVEEFKTKMSPGEKVLIQKDLESIRRLTSDFERDSIQKDMAMLTSSLKKFIQLFKKDKP